MWRRCYSVGDANPLDLTGRTVCVRAKPIFKENTMLKQKLQQWVVRVFGLFEVTHVTLEKETCITSDKN